jgi:diguanylate cyclase (GGDEF)-like protein
MLLDLDGFKEINDTLGHSVGDDLLVDVGQRLQRGLPAAGTIARLGGDEFGVVLPAGQDEVAALRVAHDLVATLDEQFVVDGISMGISASVGVAISPEHGDVPSDLIRRADIAMYSAKRSRQGVVVYRGGLDPASRESMQLVADLRRAIADGDLRLHYQPKVDMARRAIRGVEALVRWEHPEQGLLSPGTFVPLAERSELVQPLTAWVIDEAVRQCREWADDGCHLPVAVNLSQVSLLDRSIPAMVADALTRHQVPSRMLEIEITETAFVGDLGGAATLLAEIDALGVALTIDDYGTGFSSIAHLSQLPVSSIKIDRSFVASMRASSKSETIVRSIIRLARDLGLSVVAEGVETQAEWAALESLGCRMAQGYLVSKPVPADEPLAWLRHQRRPAAAPVCRVPSLV